MKRIRPFLLLVLAAFALMGAGGSGAPRLDARGGAGTDEDFRHKLSQMLQRTDQSIKILRAQITESQSAPFLPDLYLQLAELLSQRSNTLYYVQMELQKGAVAKTSDKEFSPVITAQQEAIAVYRTLLKDFPQFPKRGTVLYRLALALKSIDEVAEFVKIAGQLLKEYPGGEEAVRCRIMLGQHYFELREYKDALVMLTPVVNSTFVYERNLARYKIGLIYLESDRFKEALSQLELVIQDPELKEQDNPYEVSFKKRSVKTDLKREALTDSIRAYTHVYEKNPDPVGYYSKLAPSELLFQEAMEKLALRYIGQRNFAVAIKLLRTLSERTVDPEKIVNIYHDVLMMIPIADRVGIPVDEMHFVLEKYNLWNAYNQLSPELANSSYNFFEKQIRELGTTSHAYSKQAKKPADKKFYLERARDFYVLYLGYFTKSQQSSKMAANLADVFFSLGDFQHCGDYYLRDFNGEFGPTTDRRLLIENAILCLQKKGEYAFYDNLRIHGLLIKSVQSYFAFDRKKALDPALNFLIVKTEYEQGFFPEVLSSLLNFMKKFPRSKQSMDAGELILDYFNTRGDFVGMQAWADRMLALRLPNVAFNQKLAQIRKSSVAKVLQEKIKATSGYDDFAQGKSYLTAAMASTDAAVASFALREALAKSKRERDIETFLKTANFMAGKEKDAAKKSDILRSLAQEQIKVTRYYGGVATYAKIHGDPQYGLRIRQEAFDGAASALLVMRDLEMLRDLAKNPLWHSLSAETRGRIREQLVDVLDSPIKPEPLLVRSIFDTAITDEALLSLYKAQFKTDSETGSRVQREVSGRCGHESRQAVCLWSTFSHAEPARTAYLQSLSKVKPDIQAVEIQAQRFASITNDYRKMEGSGDAQLEMAVSVRGAELYTAFAHFLESVARANADLRPVLMQKAQETTAGATAYQNKCRSIAVQAASITPTAKYCAAGKKSPSFRDFLQADFAQVPSSRRSDLKTPRVDELQKELFGSPDGSETMLNLAKEYYDQGDDRQAVATAIYGMSTYKALEPSFRTILGCSVLNLGFYSEAGFHLKKASGLEALKGKCLARLQDLRSRL